MIRRGEAEVPVKGNKLKLLYPFNYGDGDVDEFSWYS